MVKGKKIKIGLVNKVFARSICILLPSLGRGWGWAFGKGVRDERKNFTIL